MPKYITQLAQGNSFSQTAENGQGAFSATRVWKVILNTPDEALDINAATGVNIGTPYSNANPIPCVSIEGRADGESRLVRIITATYRATPGSDLSKDPKTVGPTLRPALYSMSTTLSEITAWGGRVVTNGSSGPWVPASNPVGDLIDGITRLEPIVTISIDQYSYTDQSAILGYIGYVNSDSFNFSSLSVGVHCCMLQGVTSNPVVEQFGQSTFRGFKVSFTFGVRAHHTITRDGPQAIGWDLAVPQTGFNIKNAGLNNTGTDQKALVLEHNDMKVVVPLQLAAGTAGDKVRAMVPIPTGDGGWAQRPVAQPVALNDDGTPRSPTASPPVLINRVCLQPEMAFGNNFSNFGIRWIG
jgi:hypothetical protein